MSKSQQNGSSLVEVMVALFVLAIGLLGVLAMQSKSMQFNQSAHTYSQAVYLANDIAERIRSNLESTVDYATATADDNPNCEVSACSAVELAQWDKFTWTENVQKFLPQGSGVIESVAATATVPAHLKVKVSFDDSRADDRTPGTDGYSGVQTYALVVEF